MRFLQRFVGRRDQTIRENRDVIVDWASKRGKALYGLATPEAYESELKRATDDLMSMRPSRETLQAAQGWMGRDPRTGGPMTGLEIVNEALDRLAERG
jgi:hypothetical protein